MSWWNAKYTNGDADNEITFGSKYYERARAVEKVCRAVIDKKVKTPDDVAVVVRCKNCKHEFGGSCIICGFQKRKPEDFCSDGERKETE